MQKINQKNKGNLVKRLKSEKYIGLVYISPWLLGFIIFQFYPLLSSFIYSFSDYSFLKAPDFIGIKNYTDMFGNDNLFWQSMLVTLKYVILGVPAKVGFALIMALLLNMRIAGINFYRTVYFMPSIMGGSVALAVLWRFLFMREGIVNKLLAGFSIPSVDWLGDPRIALYTIGLLLVWQFGSSMVIFLSGLKQIPEQLYEAAKIDGARRVRTFFSVTLPLLSPMLLFALIMQTITTFQDFTAAFVITKGGPMYSTYLYGIMLYRNAFEFFKMGYASAQSWVLFIVIMAFTGLIFKFSDRWTYYEDGGFGKL